MRPADHPDFFRLPPPEGRSRESTIRLNANGHFFHEGVRVEHPGLEAAMHTWIARHPDDGRFILSNGYDWTYFTVDDVPLFVRSVRVRPDGVLLQLSDGSEEPWDPVATRIVKTADGEHVYTGLCGRDMEARFDRHAQTSLGEVLEEHDGKLVAHIGDKMVPLGAVS